MDLEKLKKDTQVIIDDVIKQTEIKAGQVFVLGLSSSEAFASPCINLHFPLHSNSGFALFSQSSLEI